MKNLILSVLFGFSIIISGWSQITEAEYFFDVDPGVGNGTVLNVANGNVIDESFTISTVGLSEGLHFINIRVKGTNDVWSLYYSDSFYVFNATFPDEFPPITSAEYFIDDDPGAGNGEPLSITSGFDIDEIFSITVPSDLANGLHTLHIRVKTAIGDWTPYIFDTFTVDSSLSADNISVNSYTLYPNPINDFLSISFKNNSDYSVRILDINGKELFYRDSINELEERFDFSKYDSGIYVIKLLDKELSQMKTVKVIKS